MGEAIQVVVRAAGEGEILEARGNRIVVKAGSEDTGGAYALVEYTVPAQSSGPGRHRHAGFDEAFYVLEGALTVQMEDRTLDVGAGGFVLVPRGAAHGYANPHAAPATFLLLASPGGFEGYFRAMVALLAAGAPPDPAAVRALQAEYDTLPVEAGP